MKPIVRLGEAANRGVGVNGGQIPDMTLFTCLKGNYGWQKMPSGVIFQWGYASSVGSASGDGIGKYNQFTIPFPSATLVVICTDSGDVKSNSSGCTNYGISKKDNMGFYLASFRASAPVVSNFTALYIAIGY
ncbi:hypothetical protein NGK36_22685 [Hafnia alvei]|uniref:gp53-like domain-containing protein n=1 Tax=Hafnia alvei TaxID=569 RepID=UPI002DB9882C|nr:hypothetical protein [Hafnia alvei]MEB7892056.1 hypothetical protein [Hafnia alvei]